MVSTRIKGIIVLCGVAAVIQVLFEDFVVFAGLTDSNGGVPVWVYLVVPTVLMGVLIVVLIGGAILTDDTLR